MVALATITTHGSPARWPGWPNASRVLMSWSEKPLPSGRLSSALCSAHLYAQGPVAYRCASPILGQAPGHLLFLGVTTAIRRLPRAEIRRAELRPGDADLARGHLGRAGDHRVRDQLAHAPRPGSPGDRQPEQHRPPAARTAAANVHRVTSPDRLDAVLRRRCKAPGAAPPRSPRSRPTFRAWPAWRVSSRDPAGPGQGS
jgi:hypothetical protein